MIEIMFLMHLTVEVANRWEPYHLNPMQEQWFSALRPKSGYVPCCSVADGLPADDWERRIAPELDDEGNALGTATHYFVKINGEWKQVPDDAVILTAGNPVGVPVVWFTTSNTIRCFVPGPEN